MRIVGLLTLLCCSQAFAERILVCGYELQSTRAGVETDPGDVAGAATIVSTPVHGGAAAAQAVAVAGVRSSFRHYFLSATPALYARVYVRLEQPVNARTMFLLLRRSSAVPAIAWLNIDAQNRVSARVWVTDYPTNVVLTPGQWHRFDLFVDERPASGSHVVQLAMDGQTFLLVEGLSLSHVVDQLEVGLNVNAENASTGVMFFDDVAVNGTVGADENGFPPPGAVYLLRPDGPSGAPGWTQGDGGPPSVDNWQAVSELPPDDGVSVIESRTNTRVADEYTTNDPPVLPGNPAASLVAVGARFVGDGTTNRSVGVRLRAGPTGTVQSSPAISAAVTTFRSNRADGYLNTPLAASRTPEGLPWSLPALESLIIGVEDTDSNARPMSVTNVWAFAEFPVGNEPPPPVPGSGPPDAGFDAGTVQDAGSTVDAGVVPDAGPPDGGTGPGDAGLVDPDGGTTSDGGLVVPDGGPADSDGGMMQSDGGVIEADAGIDPDGGRGPAVYGVGCACDAGASTSLVFLLLTLLTRRRSPSRR